jgi:hypothetical protein
MQLDSRKADGSAPCAGRSNEFKCGLEIILFSVALFLVSNWSGEKNYCARERENKKSSFRFIEMLRAEEERKIHSAVCSSADSSLAREQMNKLKSAHHKMEIFPNCSAGGLHQLATPCVTTLHTHARARSPQPL